MKEFGIRPNYNLSSNFKVREVFYSQTAVDKEIVNIPRTRRELAKVLWNSRSLARNVLQPVRDRFGIVTITSWYRCTILNDLIGGTSKSQHLIGEAADFQTPEADLFVVFEWLAKEKQRHYLEIDQAIFESRPGGRIIHVSHVRQGLNRNHAMLSPCRGSYSWFA